jgi:hypothetical protein
MTDQRLPDSTPEEWAFHRLFAEVSPPASILRPRPVRRGFAERHRPGRRLQVAFSLVTAVVVAAGTFAVFRGAELIRSGGSTPPGAAASGSATPASAACRVPTVEYGDGVEPSGENQNWVASVTAGFVDCQTGKFTVDPSAPRLGAGDHDLVYIPSAGWKETAVVLAGCTLTDPTADCGWSPDGQEFAYANDACPGPCANGDWAAGRVHVVGASGDRTITPSGELDRVLGWTDKGIVVARTSASAGATAAGGGSGIFLAGSGLSSTFADYLVDPTTGNETYVRTTDAFTADGDAMWGPDSSTTSTALARWDLSTGSESTWSVPAPGPSGVMAFEEEPGVYQVGFDAQGDPLVVTGDGSLLLLTGPDAAETIGAASQVSPVAVPVSYAGLITPMYLDDPYNVVSLPGGGLLYLEMKSETTTTFTIDTFVWDPASGVQDLGASFSVAASGPAPVDSPGTSATPTPSQAAAPDQYSPVFAGQAVTS